MKIPGLDLTQSIIVYGVIFVAALIMILAAFEVWRKWSKAKKDLENLAGGTRPTPGGQVMSESDTGQE